MEKSIDLVTPIFCINLDKYKSRWKRTQDEIKRAFIDADVQPKVHRFSAVDRTDDIDPGRGCGESFCQLVMKAKSNSWPYLIICEDDVHFVEGAYKKLKKALSCRPLDADILLAGSYSLQFSKGDIHNDHWLKLNGTYASHHFVIFFESMYDKLLSFKEFPNYRHLDRFIGNKFVTKGNINAYVIWPMIAKQYDGYSTTMRKEVKYNTVIWARKHHLLWYVDRYHQNMSAKDLPIVPYDENERKQFETSLEKYYEFVFALNNSEESKSKVFQNMEQIITQPNQLQNIKQMSLYWFSMKNILNSYTQNVFEISLHDFNEFQLLICDYYKTMSLSLSIYPTIHAIDVDTQHLLMAYKNSELFDIVLKQKYKMSFTEFKNMNKKNEYRKKSLHTI